MFFQPFCRFSSHNFSLELCVLAFELVLGDRHGGETKLCVGRQCFTYVYSRFCSVESSSERGSSLSVRLQNSTTLSYLASATITVVIRVPFPFPSSSRRHPPPVYLQLTRPKNSTTIVPSKHQQSCKPSALLSTALKADFKGEESFLT